jgi:hypothetical protein
MQKRQIPGKRICLYDIRKHIIFEIMLNLDKLQYHQLYLTSIRIVNLKLKVLEVVSKPSIGFKVKAERESQPQEYS